MGGWRRGRGATALDATTMGDWGGLDVRRRLDLGRARHARAGRGRRARGSFDGVDWHDVEVRGVGQFEPGHPETLDGWVFSGDLRPAVLTPGGIWALGREHVSSVEGVSDTEAELRWVGTGRGS